MKPERKSRGGPQVGTRSGPRARAATDRWFADPYQKGTRPARPVREEGYRPERLHTPGGSGGSIVLDPDVARVFRTSEAVNEALRLVLRLSRVVGGGRPSTGRERPPGARPASRFERDAKSGPPPRRPPRFGDAK